MKVNPCLFVRLYSNVLNQEMQKYHVWDADVTESIKLMMKIYHKKNPWDWQEIDKMNSTDFNEPHHRIAYLHKYCFFHTKVVYDELRTVLQDRIEIRDRLQEKEQIKLCSLGGGPGTDVVAVIFALHSIYGSVKCRATVIDCYIGWKTTFSSLVEELRKISYSREYYVWLYGRYAGNFQEHFFSCNYVHASLLKPMKPEVKSSIASADLLTMVKFISAAACTTASEMIKKVFNRMKEGSFVFFMDNATGGYQELVSEVADICGLVSIYGPSTTVVRMDSEYVQNRFGYKSLQEAKIVVQVWRKEICNDSYSTFLDDDEWTPAQLDTVDIDGWIKFLSLKEDESSSSVHSNEQSDWCKSTHNTLSTENTGTNIVIDSTFPDDGELPLTKLDTLNTDSCIDFPALKKIENSSSVKSQRNTSIDFVSEIRKCFNVQSNRCKSEITPPQNENSSEKNSNKFDLQSNSNASACVNKKHSHWCKSTHKTHGKRKNTRKYNPINSTFLDDGEWPPTELDTSDSGIKFPLLKKDENSSSVQSKNTRLLRNTSIDFSSEIRKCFNMQSDVNQK